MVTSNLAGFRLSPQQEDLWRAHGVWPSRGFVSQGVLELRLPLDRDRLRHAVERVVERHEILRTAFRRLPGMSLPIQVIEDRGAVLWSEPAASGQAEIERLLTEARRLPLRPDGGLVLQASLIPLGEERHALLLTLPALTADALSLRFLAHEIAALVSGEELPEPLQYADAAETLQEWLGPEDGPGAAFWRQQGSPSFLPADAAEPAVPETVHRLLPAGLAAGLARQLEAPLPLVLLAAWSAALWWETGDERRAIAVLHDGRTIDELSDAVGLYARYLPLPGLAGPGITFGELTRSVEGALTTAAARQDAFSLDRLAAGPGDPVPYWPFGFDSDRTSALSPALAFRPGFVGLGRFGLRLSVLEEDTAAGVALHYDPALYGRGQAERLLDRLERVLAGAAAQGEAPLAEVDVLGEAERWEILTVFNDTAAPSPAGATVCDLFEEQVRRAPQAPAVTAAGHCTLTFGELDARANRLARHLAALGIGPESRVGVHLEREPEMVVAVLAVLKAGGAYVPFDVGHPAERLRFLLEDAGLAALVTRERLRPAGADALRTVLVDAESADAAAVSRQDATPPPPRVESDNAAYVIYTSGSTGLPKGVVVTHRGLVNYLGWARTAYATGPGRGAPVHSPLGFDLTVTSLFVPLLAGAAITLLTEEDGIGALAEALRAPAGDGHGFGLAKITPAHIALLRQLTAEGEPPPSAACLVIGGDALWTADIAPWLRQGTRIFNEYGPTETVVGCCVHEVDPASAEDGAVPIGRPIANTRLYVMGPGLRPVPAGVPGELWIGGDGVARGYLDRPGLTAERFVPDPFASPDRAGARLYRTGDLVRLSLPGPGLEFLGRIDAQVKIRGHRIEPGEVAATLAAHPGLRDAAVAARGTGDDRRLVAWVVARDRARRPSAAELRGFLAERLPAPMIPADFVHLDVLPLTPNGKLDRRALPDPDPHRDEEVPYAPPRTLSEEVLVEIWGKVLGVDQVGIDDHFFSLGGDSIRSLQILSLAQKRGLLVTLQDLFQRPTIRQLAEGLRMSSESIALYAASPFSLITAADRERLPVGVVDAYPLARLQHGMLFHTELAPDSAIYHDQHSFHLRGPLDPELLQAAIDQVVRRHPVLRTSFDLNTASEPLQLVHETVQVPLGVDDVSHLPPEEQDREILAWLEAESLSHFDWTQAPLMRLHVHRRSTETFQFTLSFHHSILDGWSARLLLTELFVRYMSLLTDAARPEEPVPGASFRQFVAQERETLGSPASQEFWRRLLEGAAATRLPRWPPPDAPRNRSQIVAVPISRELSESLRRIARTTGAPLKSVLLAVHLKVVGFAAGQDDVVTALISNGRPEQADGDQVMGLFLNSLPFRLRLGDDTWLELIQRAFDLEREMLPHRRMPLAELGAQPLFETAFNFTHFHVYQALQNFGGLELVGGSAYEEINFQLGANFQLDLQGTQLLLTLNYPDALFPREQVEALGGYFLRALEAVARQPGDRHGGTLLLSADEQRQLLHEWGEGTPLDAPARPVHLAFEEQAARRPEAPAVSCGDEVLTYGALDRQANRLAHRLRALGVGPESLVGLFLERTHALPAALLGVWKAGGAYLPLDPAHPAERLAFIAADAGICAVVTESTLLPSLPLAVRGGGVAVVCLDDLEAEDDENPAPVAGPESLAYVIYTSGSTGLPKGVLVEHRQLSAVLAASRVAFDFREDDAMPCLAPYSFDISLFELMNPLLAGGSVHIFSLRPTLDVAGLVAGLGELTRLHAVPALMHQIVEGVQAAVLETSGLRTLFVGGEAVPDDLLAEMRRTFPAAEIHILYGPTEATIICAGYPVPAGDASPRSLLGRPLPGAEIRLCDAAGCLVPTGTPGEIWISGEGVTRGYLGRPELTGERFPTLDGRRFYRTGDLARWLPGGELQFLGRADNQVKIRGFRIEPGEIESAMAGLAGVREVVVVAREDTPGDLRLVAYVVGDVAAEGLRQSLRERLPDYMVPSAFVTLSELPLTPNGKVDRKILPAPEWQHTEKCYLAPRTPVEEVIAGIWAEVLGLEQVGSIDHFFDLGGHSLLATRVMSRLRSAFGIEMPLRNLFEAPVLTDLAARVEAALRAGTSRLTPPLVPLPRAESLPLSFAQQRLWFIDQLEPASSLYNMPVALRVEGALDSKVLALCLGEILRRHETLRTVFPAMEGSPVQTIQPASPFRLAVVDLSELPESRREALALILAGEEAGRPFDLKRGPLLRGLLLRLTKSDHVVALTMHHIVSDGWSMGILVREITALYPAFTEGKSSALPELPVQYADFAAWQSSWLRGEILASEIDFWRQRLAGLPPLLELPTDRPRSAVQSFRGAARPMRLSAGLIRQAQALSRQEGVTLFMVLLAGFQALLARYSRQEDLAVGTPVAGRNRVEIEELIGFFVNTLVLRGDLSGEPSFRDLLGRARDTTLDAYLHQEVPFEKLVQEISPDRSLSHAPLFQAVLALQNAPVEKLEVRNLRLHPLYIAGTTAKFDLTISLQEWNGGLSGAIEHSTDLFDAATIDRLIIHYDRLLSSALAGPEQLVSELPLLSATERHQLSAEWGGTGGEPPTVPTLHSCFEAQARHAPEATALTYGDATISYGLLNRRSNQLACWLRRHGVGPESRVGLCLERSLDLIVGILGVLKSGGAYVPLDPGYPQERLAHIIEDAGVQIVVGTKEPVAALPGTTRQLLLDAHCDLLETLPAGDLEPLADRANLAYVIYTSGSTGRPKGTLVSHGNVARLFDATEAWFSFGERDVWTLFHSYAFDFSVWEIWGALLYGGRLVIVPYDVSRSPELFLDLLIRERVTVLNQTPSAFAQLAKADEERAGVTTDLRLVIFGGEALDPAGLAPWFARHGDERPLLVNMYGITETTVHVTYRRLRAADARRERRSVIGVPIPDLSLAVMDHPWLQPLPIGVPGELVVGGAGLSRGYLGQPELTAERFVPDPVGGRPGARLYRSGDLGRFLPHGDVEYLGRIDQQVKIRGFRIEPGEIEAALAALAGVREAVVMVREDGTGSPRLVAYMVAEGGSAVGITEVREGLSSRLPGFMVPSTFVFLDALPLNVNAKVDRRALPEPDWRHLGASEEFSAPETTKEKVLAKVWSEVLGVERVGTHDNFFHLGGDSIRSIVVNARAEKMGVVFSIPQIFGYPVLRDLARIAEERDAAVPGPEWTKPFELLTEADRARLPEGVEDAYPLATLQAGMLFHSEIGEGTAIFHDLQSVHIRAPFVPDWMRETVRQVSLLHPVLRTSFDLASFSESLQLVHTGTNVPFEVHDLRQVPPEEQEAVLSEWLGRERLHAFDWTRPPLVAFHVHLRGEASFLFTLSFHHAILDGWSAASLLADLFRRYALFLRGEESSLDAPLAVAYRDFVALERAAIASEEARTFWSRMLDGAEPARLPRLSAPDTSTGLATEIRRIQPRIDPALSTGAQRVAREAEVPLKSLLLAVFLRALSALSGTRDVLTALISHGRPEHEDGERVLGLFLNTLPFQVNLRGGSWFDLAREVFHVERRMLPFRRFPLAEMQRMQGGRLMLDIAFNYLHFHVYQNTVGTQEIEVLGGNAYEETNFPLLTYFSLDPLSQHLQMRLYYRTSEMDKREVERFADYLCRALAAVVADPASRYDAPLFSAAERHQILTEWNDTAAQISWEPLLTQIKKRIDRTPDAVAVVFEAESLTYAELGNRVDRLGRHLRKLDCAPESRVGVALERTPDLLVALLGVLEAGAVYVPLDPEYPRERLAYLLEDARPVALITQEHLRDRLPLPDSLPVLIQEALPEADGAVNSEVPEELGGHLLAYTIYTSGSTGRPKGVMVPYAGMINHLHAKVSHLGLDKHSRVAQTASQCFDISVWQLLAPLLAGGSVHIANELTVHDPELLLRFVAHERITVLEIVPSLLSGILDSLTAASGTIDLSSLQWMIVTGEACPQGLADRWLALAPHTRLLNAYGPTECSDDVTHYERAQSDVSTSRSLPIGKPIANTRIYVLDPRGWPTPQGVAGEICVTGRGVGRGYLDLPERTAKAFLPDPLSKEPGRRLYRTGDLGCWLSDGTLEFLGRLDHQVKVRGFRIELGEIEAALTAQTGVREAVVVAREDIPGDRRLVAYVVGEVAADSGAESALRRSLRERLPDYMVPAAFVTLAAMPLTSNGKVDRKALPAPEWQSDQASYSVPRTPVEEVLAGIWAELLGLERVGAADHFFDLGGHSLLATQMISRVRAAFDVEMPLRVLFEAPILADFAARVEEDLRRGAVQLAPPLVPMPREGPLPLSFAQQRLWFIDQLEPGSPLYNIPVALRVEGPLRSEVLALCLGEIVRRHEALRTTFAAPEGSPVQVIQPAEPLMLTLVDLSGLPEKEREALAFTLTGEEAARLFDLTRGPLLRSVLLRLAEDEHVAALTMHHIVSDGWSMGILVREVTALYAAFAEERPSPLPELPVQYADYAAWQRSWLHGDILEGEIAFWSQQLAGLPPRLELPTDRPRPAMQSLRGATRPVRLSVELTRQAQVLSRRERATLFMVLLTGFQALLSRYSGQQDLAVGTPVAGRNRMEIEGLIGFFVNTLVLRGDLTDGMAGEPSFRELLGRVREAALAAHTHQDVPFEKLVQELSPERSLAHTPLFQVMLVLQNAPAESLEIRNLRLRPFSGARTTAKFDLTVSLEEHGGVLVGTAEYATDLYDAATIDRLIGHWERLLSGMIEEPQCRIGDLGLLTAEEALQLRAWNETASAYSFDRPLHAWIEDQVDRTPGAVALVFEGKELPYRELDLRANRLARRLHALAVGPEARVAVCLERSIELVVALLAVLKAGGAYVPLDPEYPQERLAFMLTDARPAVLLSSESLRDRLPEPEVPVIWLDREAAALSAESGDRPSDRCAGDLQLAYMIYTSGSTGRPKGAMVSHRSICNRLLWMQDAYRLTATDAVLQKTPFSFDVSVWELFWPLMAGARLVIARPGGHRDGAYLVDVISRERVTVLHFVPSMLQAFLEEPDLGRCQSLRRVVVSGEALSADLAERFFVRLPVDLENLYGPTEAAVDVTFWECRAGAMRRPVPIGRPIANTTIHVLDAGGRPVPVGVSGELYIGGINVGRGYLERPDLTAEKFVPDSFGQPGSRLYRTGDLVRFAADGAVEFLGRLDHQVKLRGFRIELGEIEATISTLAGIRETAVLAREDTLGGQRLVAFVTGDAAPDTLRQSLRELLPDYMVPAAFVTLDAFPLTPNGKVDRKALPAPEWQSAEKGHLEPRTPVEKILAEIWANLLGLERVGAADHFFDLGGHSLLAARVMSRLRTAFGIEMPLRDLFEAPRLTDFAARIETARRSGAGRLTPPLVPVPREGPVPLSYSQERLWFFYLLEPESPAFHLGGAVRLTGALALGAFAASLSETVRRHEVLRTRYQESGDGPVQIVDPAAPLPLPLIDLGGLPEDARERELRRLAERERACPFDLTREWPLRTHLVRLSREEHATLFTLHHIAGDGWSLGLLTREVGAHYAAFAAGSAGRALPEPVVQYADFSLWQRGWLNGEQLEAQLGWWRNRLAGPLPVLELPQQRDRPETPRFRGAACPVAVPADLCQSLEKIGRREGATLFMTLLAGFKALLHLYSGQEDLLVGTNVANRDRSEVEGLIGFFVNNLVLRTDLSGDPGFRELVQRVRDVTLGAFAHQEIPFEKVLEAVQPRRQTVFAPLFQVMFVLQNFPTAEQRTGSLQIAPLELESHTANFDLTLMLSEQAGGLGGVLRYDTDLFAETAMARMADHFLALLHSIAEDPDRPLSTILLTDESDIRQLASAFSEDC